MEIEYYNDYVGYDCIFKGLSIGNCSIDKRMLFICDNHLSRIFNLDVKSINVCTSENRYTERIKYVSLNSRTKNKIFPILYEIRGTELCFRENATTLLTEYISSLDIPKNKIDQVTQILSHAISGFILYGRGMICENTSIVHQFLNDDRLKQTLDRYWGDATVTAIINVNGGGIATNELSISRLPLFYKMLLSLFTLSSIANDHERRSITPNLSFNISDGYIVLTRDVLLSNNETDYSSPLVILGRRNVDGELSLHPMLKNTPITLYNFEAFKFAPCTV